MQHRGKPWIWYVCTLMMVATVINYMDRMTLNLLANMVQREFSLNNEQYGQMEFGFGIAFAVGSLVFGALIDRIGGVYWLYPLCLAGWSTVGFLSGLSQGFVELLCLRILLGFFEAGHFPCALKAVQILMTERDRPVGNSILQSGSALGAILAPQAVKLLLGDSPHGWRQPFLVVGAGGGAWVVFWLLSLRPRDLPLGAGRATSESASSSFFSLIFSARFLALLIVVMAINLTWQFFRVWLPKFLGARGYSEREILDFVTFYYLAAWVGSLGAGFVSGWLGRRGTSLFVSQTVIFTGCSLLTALTVPAAFLPAQPLLLALLLLVAAGSLGVYTPYYSLTQHLSTKHQGKISGLLSTIVWLLTAPLHPRFGAYLDRTGDFDLAVGVSGCLPLISLIPLLFLWNRSASSDACGLASRPADAAKSTRSDGIAPGRTGRIHQAVLIGSTLLACWLGMQAVHELGHVLGATATRGAVKQVVLHPLTISRTDLAFNPEPLLVVWAGPIVGVLLPLILWTAAARLRVPGAFVFRFFAGFCLIANGAYISLGSLDGIGDCGEMLRHGSQPWQLWLFGAVTVPAGFWLWHGQGKEFGLGSGRSKVDQRVAYAVLGAFLLLVALAFFVDGR